MGFEALITLVLAFALSWLMTAMVRRYALTHGVLDHPNARSSHSAPTPRGGGVAIVVSFLLATLGLGWAEVVPRDLVAAITGAGLLVAALGFVDDHAPMPARWRFLGHLAAAIWVVWWMGPIPPVPLFGKPVELGLAATLLSIFYLTWMPNLFNFMDGIDGIASLEAMTVALGGAAVWLLAGRGGGWVLAIVFAACVAGFLAWNFPPARIFMGDAGSGFIGLVIGALSLWCSQAAPHLFWSWFILVGCFMVDGTTTLVRRVLRHDRFNEAHRSHAYQYAARKHRSHKAVSIAFLAVTVAWLFPLSLAVALGAMDGLVGVVIAYLPLGVLAFQYKAGDRTAQET